MTAKTMNPSNPASPTPWDPDGDGDDDSNPEGDTDNDFWDADGNPIAAAWLKAGKEPPPSEANSAEYDPEVRAADAKYSMPDGSYPISTCADVTNAANLAHHSKTYSFAEVKAHVMKALSGLSCPMSDLPDTWKEENAAPQDGETRERPPREGLVRAVGGLEIRDAPDGSDSPGTLVGHLAVFGQWSEINSIHEGHFMEQMASDAFNRTIQNNGTRMKVTFNHGKDPSLGDKVLGIPSVLEPDDYGVRYEVPLFDTQYNRELAPGLKAGAYGSSFRFNVLAEDFNKKPGRSAHNPSGIPERTVKEVRMQEFGPVTFPAYEGATAGMRSLTDRYTLEPFLQDPGKLGPLVDSIVDANLTPPAARGTQSAPAPASPSATKPPRLKPVRKPEQRSENHKPMTRDERRDRIAELETWIRDTNETYAEEAMPQEIRLEWDRNNVELDNHRKDALDIEQRAARVETLASRDALVETPRQWETTVPRGVQQINRMSEGEIYDLNTVRTSNFMAPEQTARELKDRAKRAIEIAKFPTLDPKLHEFTQARTENLLDYSDADEGGLPEIARRLLVTGGPIYHRAFHKYLAGVVQDSR